MWNDWPVFRAQTKFLDWSQESWALSALQVNRPSEQWGGAVRRHTNLTSSQERCWACLPGPGAEERALLWPLLVPGEVGV